MIPSGLDTAAATVLRNIARNEVIKSYVQQNTSLYSALLRAALRFIGGETLLQCVATVRSMNKQGFATAIAFIGNDAANLPIARQATEEFLGIVKCIREHRLHSSICLDLSHIGMTIDVNLAYENASVLAQAAQAAGIEIMISAEGSDRTHDVFNLHRRLCERYANVGITLQAYLYRSVNDLVSVLDRPGKLRLVKGTYEESPDVARRGKEAVDSAYREFLETLLVSGHACSIATHDPALLDHAHKFIQELHFNKAAIEFEMLYGVALERLRQLLHQGYQARVYIPYGKEWYRYVCHRLAEYPPNIYKAITDAGQNFS